LRGVALKKNRDRLGIVAAILEAANSGASKTHIMFSANLSFKLLGKYLDICIQAGFIRVNENKYTLTAYGKELLIEYKQIHDRYNKAQKTLDSMASERERLSQLCAESKLFEKVKTVIK
jgi:predicted transcriptional regulator